MKNIFLILTLFIVSTGSLSAQMDTLNPMKYNKSVSFHPQYLFQQGIRIDFDFKINSKNWLQVCPQLYMAENSDGFIYSNSGYNKLLGLGINIYNRSFVNQKQNYDGLYLSYGINYAYFDIAYDEYDVDVKLEANTFINRIGADIMVGYQYVFFEKLLVDLYSGMGLRYSDRVFTGTSERKYNNSMIGYGYTGTMILAGVRLGLIY